MLSFFGYREVEIAFQKKPMILIVIGFYDSIIVFIFFLASVLFLHFACFVAVVWWFVAYFSSAFVV